MFNPFSRPRRDRSSSHDQSFHRPMEGCDATRLMPGTDEDGLSSVGLGIVGLSLRTPFDHAAPSQPYLPPPIHPPLRQVRPIWGNESTAAAINPPTSSKSYYEHYASSYDEEHAATPKPPKLDDLLRKPIDIPQYSEVLARRHTQCRPKWCYWGEESTCTKANQWVQPAAASGPLAPLRSTGYNPRMDPRIIARGDATGWQGPQQTRMPTAMAFPYYPQPLPGQTSYSVPYQNQTWFGFPMYCLPTIGVATVTYPTPYYYMPPQGTCNNGVSQRPAPLCKVTADGWPVSDPPPPYWP